MHAPVHCHILILIIIMLKHFNFNIQTSLFSIYANNFFSKPSVEHSLIPLGPLPLLWP